jgi:hypothetical protein
VTQERHSLSYAVTSLLFSSALFAAVITLLCVLLSSGQIFLAFFSTTTRRIIDVWQHDTNFWIGPCRIRPHGRLAYLSSQKSRPCSIVTIIRYWSSRSGMSSLGPNGEKTAKLRSTEWSQRPRTEGYELWLLHHPSAPSLNQCGWKLFIPFRARGRLKFGRWGVAVIPSVKTV